MDKEYDVVGEKMNYLISVLSSEVIADSTENVTLWYARTLNGRCVPGGEYEVRTIKVLQQKSPVVKAEAKTGEDYVKG